MIDESSHVVISCEGPCERFVVKKLSDAERFVFPRENIIGIGGRNARSIESEFLTFAYDWPVAILRVVDSPTERFTLGKLYSDRFEVESVYTRPEIEILIIIHEDKWDDFQKHKSKVKPSVYCKRELGMKSVKSHEFLEGYWDADSLVAACGEYKRLHKPKKGELCLADILK